MCCTVSLAYAELSLVSWFRGFVFSWCKGWHGLGIPNRNCRNRDAPTENRRQCAPRRFVLLVCVFGCWTV
jgi:hypothetical protein